ncbi:hypothetical protein QJ850_gp444 [Acanthamoeba polyphaga mimivirus]|uniref:Uncharacterized protein n=1 Tax=Acanthamoeba polyphaga mimivirus Kroon TaxID=3069720 RepID=A0A0G2Y3A1_9VIRU|nr:hypothetical protein QJ850_gp444 [Acanthamoeba polyphaga mimivirus]AKI80255.1 hypothetical protein [Acanthamoeba polyphaga mimivirus Kroon]
MEYIIQEINSSYFIVGYIDDNEPKENFVEQFIDDFIDKHNKNIIADIICLRIVRDPNEIDIYVVCRSNINLKILDNRFKNINDSILHICSDNLFLPFEQVDDHGIISLLNNPMNNIETGTIIMLGKKLNYSLIKTESVDKTWLEGSYLELIKRKFIESPFITFETISDAIEYDDKKEDIITLKQYIMIYNDKTITNPENRLQYAVFSDSKGFLIFDDNREFNQIFNNHINYIVHSESSDEEDNDNNDDTNNNDDIEIKT